MKNYLTLLASTLFIYTTSFAQWTMIADYGGGAAYSTAAVTIGNRAFVGGGNPSLKSFYEYSTSSDQWTKRADIAGGVNRASPIRFSINGKAYVGGGGDLGQGTTNTFYEYDPVNDQWNQKSDFPGGDLHSGCYVSTSTKGYVICGSAGSAAVAKVWEYDPAGDKWTEKAAYPAGPTYWPVGFAINDKVYVGTGSVSGSSVKLFYEFDPSNNKWTQKAPFMGSARSSAVAFALGGIGYIGGGTSDFTSTFKDFYSYDPALDQWKREAELDFPVNSTAWSTAFVIGEDVYVGTGASVSGSINASSRFYKARPGTVGLQEVVTQQACRVYPNPSTGLVHIDIENLISGNCRVTIFNSFGMEVYNESVPIEANHLAMDIRSLGSGSYYFRIETSSGNWVRRLAVQHE